MPSPPPPYTFLDVPVLLSGGPSWEEAPEGRVVGFDHSQREVLITNIIDATPDHKHIVPGPSIWPFILAVFTAIAFAGTVFNMWWGPIGGGMCLIAFIGWFWPKRHVILSSGAN